MNCRSDADINRAFETVGQIVFGLREQRVSEKKIVGIIKRGVEKRLTKNDRLLLRTLPEKKD